MSRFEQTDFSTKIASELQGQAIEKEKKRIKDALSRGEILGEKEAIFLVENHSFRDFRFNIESFTNLSEETANFLIRNKCSGIVVDYPEKFGIILDESWATKMIENGGSYPVAQNPEKFKITLDDTWATKMIENRRPGAVEEGIKNFTNLSEKTACTLIENGCTWAVCEGISSFTNLSEKTARALIEKTNRFLLYKIRKNSVSPLMMYGQQK
ncbi:MAG: hypothetical protein CR954_00050 [Candidatus Moraniibacteriota bacterium]|nr:MAG: hypothetical protein CR954_00050 [Candidatus Moranbacteria bacterium]